MGWLEKVHYFDWFVNYMIAKKKNGKNKVCIDFTNLNKVCLSNSFPFPMFDRLVDAITNHEMMSFLNALSRYNQILLHLDDQEKTSFMT